MTERYGLGYGQAALQFVSRRTLDSHGAFFIPYLASGMQVLDVGCGPGTITLGIAGRVLPGAAIGVDISESQVELARAAARDRGVTNARFQVSSAYALPFADGWFDAVFSHALLEHLSDVPRALREFLRVLKPAGVLGVCTPDWGGFLVSPWPPAVRDALRAYTGIQGRNGGDPEVGHKLLGYLGDAGFAGVTAQAYYENYEPCSAIIDLLAFQLERDGERQHAEALRAWLERTPNLFAEAWVACIGRKP